MDPKTKRHIRDGVLCVGFALAAHLSIQARAWTYLVVVCACAATFLLTDTTKD